MKRVIVPVASMLAIQVMISLSVISLSVMMPEVARDLAIDPKLVGERVIDAIRNKTFYAFVSAVPADVIRTRHRRIEAELETRWTTAY
jgi:hypothetical protein